MDSEVPVQFIPIFHALVAASERCLSRFDNLTLDDPLPPVMNASGYGISDITRCTKVAYETTDDA